MVKRIINRVTITGADDSIEPWQLMTIAKKYSFVEFGILLSKKWEGSRRFSSLEWLRELCQLKSKEKELLLSGHLCGFWVIDICQGHDSFFQERGDIWRMFDRFQLNFHAEIHPVRPSDFYRIISKYSYDRQVIIQMDGVNNGLYGLLVQRQPSINVVPLFDLSGGTGVLPKKWPNTASVYSGYAGGLSPENLAEQMEKIAEVVGQGPIWIDAETYLRSNYDTVFDLDKVRSFLEVAKPWVI